MVLFKEMLNVLSDMLNQLFQIAFRIFYRALKLSANISSLNLARKSVELLKGIFGINFYSQIAWESSTEVIFRSNVGKGKAAHTLILKDIQAFLFLQWLIINIDLEM